MLIQAAKIRKVHMLAPVMAALAQIATNQLQADEGILDRVKELLRKFRNDVEVDYRTAEEEENTSIEEFNENKTRTEQTIANLEGQEESLGLELQALGKCILTQTGIIQTATAKRDRNQRLWDDATAMCTSFTNEYESASKGRKEELQLLEVIRTKVEEKFGKISESVNETESEYENEATYERSTFQG